MKDNVEEPKVVQLEGNVQRAVDFNLKKEDIMLVILEGRKEVMELTIAQLQQESSKIYKEFEDSKYKFRDAVLEKLHKAFNKNAKALNRAKTTDTAETQDGFTISLQETTEEITYTVFSANSIQNMDGGGGRNGGTLVKTEYQQRMTMPMYYAAKFKVRLSLAGELFLNPSPLFINTPKACLSAGNNNSGNGYLQSASAYYSEILLGEEELNIEELKKMKEFQKMKSLAEAYGEAKRKLTDIVSTYELYNKNTGRAKAAMIKEMLAADTNGKKLLESINSAAKSTKLLN